jgi:ABC-2 type transport system ATP-binding protein
MGFPTQGFPYPIDMMLASRPSAMPLYELHDLVKIYPGQAQPANDHITLTIEAGEIFGLLGDNGAGKSTLVRQMANLIAPTSGQLIFLGRPFCRISPQIPLYVGYMPQEASAINNLTVGEALYFTAHLRGLSRASARQERDRLLELWQIEPLRRKIGLQLSGGERRLMQLAVAMAGNPPVLLLDEPTNDLDPVRRKQVWEILRRLNREQGTTIIFITHDAIEAEKIIQRVGIMRQGKLAAVGKPGELKAQVDQKLRLELFTARDEAPHLLDGFFPRRLDVRRWLVYLERPQAGALIDALDFNEVDDFRLYSATLGYILTGNLVLALMFDALSKVANNFSFMKARGMLNYFACLPIQRCSLILATAAAFFVLSLPSLFVTLILGALALKLPLVISPLLVLVLPLAATTLVGLGALIGVLARSPEESGSISLTLTLVMLGLGPVVVPPERLPDFLVKLGVLSPATYAASALRQVLLGPVTGRLALDLVVLAAIAVLVFWFAGR